ncbi:tetratricopeptide repeat protein [Lentzea sp. NPDC102401]|uniref:tetratricopeptide repeat protein n=1 Tax=Lentzea sp. NPDC102401 TaxID=3364128 RepID=UPI0037FC5830
MQVRTCWTCTCLCRGYGPEHPQTLVALLDLAQWRARSGDVAGALAGYNQVIPDLLRVFGPHHTNSLTARTDLVEYRGLLGDPAGAVRELEQLMAECLHVLGPDHPDTQRVQDGLEHWRQEAEGQGVSRKPRPR